MQRKLTSEEVCNQCQQHTKDKLNGQRRYENLYNHHAKLKQVDWLRTKGFIDQLLATRRYGNVQGSDAERHDCDLCRRVATKAETPLLKI